MRLLAKRSLRNKTNKIGQTRIGGFRRQNEDEEEKFVKINDFTSFFHALFG